MTTPEMWTEQSQSQGILWSAEKRAARCDSMTMRIWPGARRTGILRGDRRSCGRARFSESHRRVKPRKLHAALNRGEIEGCSR